jgi:hypothetical protein
LAVDESHELVAGVTAGRGQVLFEAVDDGRLDSIE